MGCWGALWCFYDPFMVLLRGYTLNSFHVIISARTGNISVVNPKTSTPTFLVFFYFYSLVQKSEWHRLTVISLSEQPCSSLFSAANTWIEDFLKSFPGMLLFKAGVVKPSKRSRDILNKSPERMILSTNKPWKEGAWSSDHYRLHHHRRRLAAVAGDQSLQFITVWASV